MLGDTLTHNLGEFLFMRNIRAHREAGEGNVLYSTDRAGMDNSPLNRGLVGLRLSHKPDILDSAKIPNPDV
jgi:hypothetical protein